MNDTQNLIHNIEGHAFGARIATGAARRDLEQAKRHNEDDVHYRRDAVAHLREALAVTGDAAKNRAIVACMRSFMASYEADCLEAHAYQIDGLQHVEAAHVEAGEITLAIDEASATQSQTFYGRQRQDDLRARRIALEVQRAKVGSSGGGSAA